MASPQNSPILARSSSADSALSKHLSQVFNYMAGGVGISGLVAYGVYANETVRMIAVQGQIIWLIAIVGLAFTINGMITRLQPAAGLAVFAAYSALMGLALSPAVLSFTNSSIATAFGTAAIMFAGTAAWGYFTKRNLSGLGVFLSMGIIGIFAASIIGFVISLFGVNVGPLGFIINLLAVPLFAGLTAYEVNTIRTNFAAYGGNESTRTRLAILSALTLYISFINMFMSLLSLFGDRR